jgi:hypothetical protein
LPAVEDVVERLGLVGIELVHPALFERGFEPGVDAFGKRRIGRLDGRQTPHGGHDFVRRIGPVERRPRGQDGQGALERELFIFVRATRRERRLSTMLEATLSLSKCRGRIERHKQ